MRDRLVGIVVAAAVLAGSCSSSLDSEACTLAAESQAIAEDRWTSLLREHAAADHDLAEDLASQSAHDESAGLVLDARVEMILAEAETRRICG